jgi:hypothetical protein
MEKAATSDRLIFPTSLAEKLATEDHVFYPPRRLTAMAKRGEIPSVRTLDGKVILIDSPAVRELLRQRSR